MPCTVEFCVVHLEIVALHVVVELAAVEFCSEELLFLDVVFKDEEFPATSVPFKGTALVCDIHRDITTVIAAKMANAYFLYIFSLKI